MLWERAKNLILFFFVLVNILLASFLWTDHNRYRLTPDQERAINQVMTQNKVNWYFKMIRQYPPMRPLSVSGFSYDTDALLAIFFGADNAATPLDTPGKEVYVLGEAQLEISNGYISYNNPAGFEINPVNNLSLCDAFIQQYYPDYRPDGVWAVEEGTRFSYRQVYKNYTVYTNFIECLVTDNGLVQIEMQYGNVYDFSGSPVAICAPDEALLTFIQHIRVVYGDVPVLITAMDIVYYQDEFSAQDNVTLRAEPYYRIFIEHQDMPFMVNAYTNTMR